MQSSEILSIFDLTMRPISPPRAEAITTWVQGKPLQTALANAIAAASQDGPCEALQDLLALREALRERDDPERLVTRLNAEADDLDRRAERQDAQAAEFFGKAAYRRAQEDASLAAQMEGRALAAEGAACALRTRAMTLRLCAARGRARLWRLCGLMAVTQPVA